MWRCDDVVLLSCDDVVIELYAQFMRASLRMKEHRCVFGCEVVIDDDVVSCDGVVLLTCDDVVLLRCVDVVEL